MLYGQRRRNPDRQLECSGCSGQGIYELYRNHSEREGRTRLERHGPPPSVHTEVAKKETLLDYRQYFRTFEVHCAFDVSETSSSSNAMFSTTS